VLINNRCKVRSLKFKCMKHLTNRNIASIKEEQGIILSSIV